MPLAKAQLQRLTRIVSELKENRYPNTKTLTREFRRVAEEENILIDCSEKTILRDMRTLKTDFHCPLDFDRERNGYYLKHHGWNFNLPAILDDNEMLAAVIGARVSEEIFPAPVRNHIREAVDCLLANYNPDFLDTASLSSLTILSGLFINIPQDIFLAVFEGWQKHLAVRIDYADYQGEISTRTFEPHTFVFFNNSWYSKGFCRMKNEPRTFALHRIRKAELTQSRFEPSKKIIDSVTVDDFFGFRKIQNVKLKIAPQLRDILIAHPMHSRQTISGNGIVFIPSVSEEILFPWLLSQETKAELLEPAGLRAELREKIQNMLALYR